MSETVSKLEAATGHQFVITSRYEEPACRMEIHCYFHENRIYKAALRVGVHTSDDWASIDLDGIHTLGFRCKERARQDVDGNTH